VADAAKMHCIWTIEVGRKNYADERLQGNEEGSAKKMDTKFQSVYLE